MVIEQGTSRQIGGIATQLRAIDTDIHHDYHDLDDLFPYLSQVYRERLRDYGFGLGGGLYANNGGVLGRRGDTLDPEDPEDKATAAKNVKNVVKNLLVLQQHLRICLATSSVRTWRRASVLEPQRSTNTKVLL